MGGQTSKLATLELTENGGFTHEQLKRTQRRFVDTIVVATVERHLLTLAHPPTQQHRFHRLGSGRVAYRDIANAAGIDLNPLVTSLFDTYSGMKGSGTLSYPELLVLLTDLSKLATSPEACTQGRHGTCIHCVNGLDMLFA